MKRIMGLDLGTRSLGIAISDALGIAAHGKENFRFPEKGYQQAIKHTVELLKKENIKDVALGYALNMDGTESASSKAALIFKDELLKHIPDLNVVMIDERLTTVQAHRILLEANMSREKRKKVIDMESAVLILETYLEQIKNGREKQTAI